MRNRSFEEKESMFKNSNPQIPDEKFLRRDIPISKISPPVIIPTITLNEYLSRYNRKRILDNVIRKWFFANNKNNPNPKKSKEEWDKILQSFYNETDK
jgi:hypothetical protein